MPILIQVCFLILASCVGLAILSFAWAVAYLARETPETLDRVLYRKAPPAGSLQDPITTAVGPL